MKTILNEYMEDPEFAYHFQRAGHVINISEEFLALYGDYSWRGVWQAVKESAVALWQNRRKVTA